MVKSLSLPICALSMLAVSQFASAQAIQPSSPCPPGKIAQNYNRGAESGSQTAQNHNRGTGGNSQVAQKDDRGTSAQVAGRPIDPLDCR